MDEGDLASILETLGDKMDVKLVNELKISDEDGFRVVAFKKEDENKIVVAYKGKEPEEGELLLEEMNKLQLVYDRLKREHSGAEIIFTGYEQGADLGFISLVKTSVELQTNVA